MTAFRLWKNSFSVPPRYILIISLPTYHFLKYQTLVTIGNRTTVWLDRWQKALHSLSFPICAQGCDNGQIWARKSILLQKIGRDLWEFLPLPSARSAVRKLEFLIVPGAFSVQILGSLFFAPGAEFLLPRAQIFSVTVVFGTHRNWNNSLRPIKGHHYPS